MPALSAADLVPHLPLHLLKSETIPPSPTPSPTTGSAVLDWLPDFSGYSWVAYGAASLLVVSHLPSPHSPPLGPLFRQVFDLSDDVVSVSWSLRSPASGDLAAAAGDRVFLFQYESSLGSFCWSQTALLVQSAKVEAITWTGSGDGIIAGGTEVVLWKRNIKSWEIAWKFRMNVSQTLVSATWSLEGLSATGAYPTKFHGKELGSMSCHACNCVSVFHNDGKSGYVATELQHPQPVLSLQWRPCTGSQSNRAALYAPRQVLLTSCLDGTVRLWSEVDGSRIRKGHKDDLNQLASRRSFCVVAVIEINQSLNGMLGTDIFLSWASDIEGVVCLGDGPNQLFCTERDQTNEVGRCEWLVGFGPGKMLTFWAVHCLDDITTMRSPRVTLWKRQNVLEPALRSSCDHERLRCTGGSHFGKVAIWRKLCFGPPAICSLIQLFPCSSLALSVLCNQSLLKAEDSPSHTCETDYKLSSQSGGVLDTLGHSGKILQVAVHPFMYETELAVSLDSNGLLIFWSISTSSCSFSGLPSFTPSWQPVGKMTIWDTVAQGVSLNWFPLCLDEDRIFLIGHVQGIDCYIIRTFETKEQEIVCHKFCTIPFIGPDDIDGPDKIVSVPLDSTCKDTFRFNHFLLFGVWMKKFHAQSWQVTLHCYQSSGKCCQCDSDSRMDGECSTWIYKTDFSGKTYCMAVNLYSSYSPDIRDEVTSFSLANPTSVSSTNQILDVMNDSCSYSYPYHMATGHSDGSSRLWRIKQSKSSDIRTPFELVGMFSSTSGPITAICVADRGQKIATVCSTGQANRAHTLYIWEPLHLLGTGTVEMVDKICLNGEVVALHWLLLENMFFLGVCFQNELHIYSQRVYSVQTSSSEASIWVCIAVVRDSPTIYDFLLGPNGAIIVIHEKCFTLFSHWSILMGNKHLFDGHATPYGDLSFKNNRDRGSPACRTGIHPVVNSQNEGCVLKLTEAAEKLCGPLPFYHPEALLINIYSGNWRRAYVAVCHLVECLASSSMVEQQLIPAKSGTVLSQINLSNYFEGQLSNSRASQIQWSNDLNTTTWSSNSERGQMLFGDSSAYGATNGNFNASVTVPESSVFHDTLGKLHVLEAFTDLQKIQMFAIVDLLHEIHNSQSASPYESLDETGRRFWCAIRLQQLEYHRRHNREPLVDELVVDSKLIGWAFHSDCQANLFDTILPTEPTWQEMRKIGAGFWLSNLMDLRTKMEKLARRQYLKNKDPKACALLYIALNRLQVLAGLFKISKDEKDKPLVAFLSRNFQEEKHKAAALKNAYVLMGRHQIELAVAFFLLGGDITSAITVCAKTLGDGQLALVICRLVEGLGRPSERHLISKILLPSAIEKGDFWLASVLEWILENYLQSFLVVFGLQGDTNGTESEKAVKRSAFVDPSIGQYCQILVAKNSLRNAVGEQNTAVLCRWAVLVTASAFNKCGLPLEALEGLSSSASIHGVLDKGTDVNSDCLPEVLRPSSADSSRWLANEVACCLVYQVKLDLAVKYVAKLVKEHPGCLNTTILSTEAGHCSLEHEISQYGALLEKFEQKLDSGLAYLEQKFALVRNTLLNKIFVSSDSDRLLIIRYHLLNGPASQIDVPKLRHTIGSSSQPLKHIVNVAEILSYSLSRFLTASTIASLQTLASSEINLSFSEPDCCFQFVDFYTRGFVSSICSLRSALMISCNGYSKELIRQSIITLDLCLYCVYFASAMLQHNEKALTAMMQPVLASLTNGGYREIDTASLKAILCQVVEALSPKSRGANTCGGVPVTNGFCDENGSDKIPMIPEDEKWITLWAYLWHHLSKFINFQLKQSDNNLTCNSVDSTALASSVSLEPDADGFLKHIRQVFIEVLGNTVTHISFHTALQLYTFFWHKVENGTAIPTLMRLEDFDQSKPGVFANHQVGSPGSSGSNEERASSSSELLAKLCDNPKAICEMFAQLPIKLSVLIHHKPVKGWNYLHMGVLGEHERVESYKQEGIFDGSPRGTENRSPPAGSVKSHNLFDSNMKVSALEKESIPFHSPRDICRRNGELLEALCINSVGQRQAVLASSKKGISFFSWGDELPLRYPSEYIWAEADWPQKGWAGAESTPVPTSVTPGSNGGSGLGSSGATFGDVSQARPVKDSTGGVFGIPGYAGIGATGMGWGIQDDFDHFFDPPATIDNINARALASHPLKPYFLVGSSNTHIYLWEFGEEKAVATYGVLVAANVPPPYPLASISALQFDCSGHRFANSASDGTVCTWQLEVGGRSNVIPTDTSICFNGHASDICHVATSGSVIAAAGYSSNGVNVVVWDTLAPTTSSRASVMCHEGGACSISVFDNDVGTGSISPLIVTGGKGGDVGLHDFRYIATGKTKRQRGSNTSERFSDAAAIDVRSELSSITGDQNRHGMLWYIPKAHSGSITKISTIPNTSYFLTGSKDGDVKLWDAKRASLVYHWPKLHERHTFLQRGSQSFGGVTRVGVTDIQVISDGFLTCGGDGSVKLLELNKFAL